MRLPPAAEREQALDLVEHVDLGRQPGLHRVLGKDPLGETVDRADRGAVEVDERGLGVHAPVRRRRGVVDQPLERLPDTRPELTRRGLGEGDCRDLAHGDAAHEHQRDHTIDELLGLARAGAGLDEQQLVEAVRGDPPPCRLVDERGRGHSASSSSTVSAWNAANSGASSLASYCASRSTGHTAS